MLLLRAGVVVFAFFSASLAMTDVLSDRTVAKFLAASLVLVAVVDLLQYLTEKERV